MEICESPNVFWDSLINTRPDEIHILLPGIGLPGISEIKAIPLIPDKVPDINIVMLTACAEEDLIVKYKCAGAKVRPTPARDR